MAVAAELLLLYYVVYTVRNYNAKTCTLKLLVATSDKNPSTGGDWKMNFSLLIPGAILRVNS